MEQHDISEPFEKGAVLFPDLEVSAAETPWYSHPAWDGVYLKDLVTGKETGGAFSYHLVRVLRNCEAADHDHETQWEYNVILGGTGSILLDGQEIAVEVGQTFVTPPRTHHTVSAGSEELSIIALFVPALV